MKSLWDFVELPKPEVEEAEETELVEEELPIAFQLLPIFPSPSTHAEFTKAYKLMHPQPGSNPQIIWP